MKHFKKVLSLIIVMFVVFSAILPNISLVYADEESSVEETTEEVIPSQESSEEEISEIVEPQTSDDDTTETEDTSAQEDSVTASEGTGDESESDEDSSMVLMGAPVLLGAPSGGSSDAINLSATLTFKDVNNGNQTVQLTEDGDIGFVPYVNYFEQMTLQIEATYGAGTNKIVEITLPEGMTFHKDVYESSGYLVYGTDDTLKQIITPNQQTEESKKNITILGVDQKNGTMTLEFNGNGEANEAETVRFSVPVAVSGHLMYNSALFDSGTAWYIDEVDNPITVTESYTDLEGTEHNATVSLNKLTIQNEETVWYQNTWESTVNPKGQIDEPTAGGEGFRVQTQPNNRTYTRQIAFKKYSITFTAPVGTSFEGFNTSLNNNTLNNAYTLTTTQAGDTTPDGMTVEPGRVAFTFTVTDRILTRANLLLYPIWKFSAPLQAGDQALVKVEDVHMQFYGRDTEHVLDSSKFPSQVYDILAPVEEVFVNVKYDDPNNYTDGYYADHTLNLGAPGYEHVQEREIGYYMIGNRGLADSTAKHLTFTYDENNTGTYGVTQQWIPTLDPNAKVGVTGVRYKLYDANTNTYDSDWTEMTAEQFTALQTATVKSNTKNISVLNLSDIGVSGDSGKYFKAIQVDVTTIPANSYLRTGQTTYTNANQVLYYTYGRVLNKEVYPMNKNAARESKGQLKARLTISDQATPAEHNNVEGLVYDATTGKSIIVMSYDGYTEKTNSFYNHLTVGSGSETVKVGVFDHDWATANVQDIKAIYVISPFGEEIENMTVQYVGGKNGFNNGRAVGYTQLYGKIYTPSSYTDTLTLNATTNGITYTEVTDLSAELLAKYPNARLYKIDFTGVTDTQGVYDKRAVGMSAVTAKTATNTPYSTNSKYSGIGLSYQINHDIRDTPGTYTDLTWVEYDTYGADNVSYVAGGHHANLNADIFKLTGSTDASLRLSLLQPITLMPTEKLLVTSSAKQDSETDDFYKTYVDGDDSTILGVHDQIDYKLTVENLTSTPISEFSAYWAVPKTGENWGVAMNPEGAFNYSLNLENALQNVPEGYAISYAKNVTPTGNYQSWGANDWVAQEDTASWTKADWDAVNFVRVDWVGTSTKTAIESGDEFAFIFDLAVDTVFTTVDQMYTLDVWAPYFRMSYTSSTSWLAGEPVAAMLTPGELSGVVWEDTNYDGKYDAGEPVVPGATVSLYDISTGTEILRTSTTTDANGKYYFYGLFDGLSESGLKDTSRIVIERPATYTDFTVFENEMADFAAHNQTDGDVNVIHEVYVDVTLDRVSKKEFNAGLINHTPVDSVTVTKEVADDANNETAATPFVFVLMEGIDEVERIGRNGKGEVSFSDLTLDLNSTRTFTIIEDNTNDPDIIYDTTVYDWEITSYKEDGKWQVKSVTSLNGNEADVVFTNTFDPVLMDVNGKIVWNDSNNADGVRPNSVTVNLLVDGLVVDTKTISASDNWAFTFTNVRMYNNGVTVVYTVSEDAVAGYTTTITGDMNDGFTITNTRTSRPVVPDTNDDPKTPNKTKPVVPDTSDHTNVPLYFGFMIGALAFGVITAMKRKQYN